MATTFPNPFYQMIMIEEHRITIVLNLDVNSGLF